MARWLCPNWAMAAKISLPRPRPRNAGVSHPPPRLQAVGVQRRSSGGQAGLHFYTSPLTSGTHHSAAWGARLVRRDLAATAALFARSIDRHLAQHDLNTSRAAPGHVARGHAE